MIKITAIDCSLANVGLVLFDYDPQTEALTPIKIKLVQTEPMDKKLIRRNSDDMRRAGELLSAIRKFEKASSIMIAEIPMGTQSSRGAISNGVVFGVLSSITLPLIQVTPAEAKMVSVGRKTATKREMIEWATALHPQLEWKRDRGKADGKFVDANEHMADAVAIGYAGIGTNEFKVAISMMLSMKRNAELVSSA